MTTYVWDAPVSEEEDCIFNQDPKVEELLQAEAKGMLLVVLIPTGSAEQWVLEHKLHPSSSCAVYEYKCFGASTYEEAKARFLKLIKESDTTPWFALAGTTRGVINGTC